MYWDHSAAAAAKYSDHVFNGGSFLIQPVVYFTGLTVPGLLAVRYEERQNATTEERSRVRRAPMMVIRWFWLHPVGKAVNWSFYVMLDPGKVHRVDRGMLYTMKSLFWITADHRGESDRLGVLAWWIIALVGLSISIVAQQTDFHKLLNSRLPALAAFFYADGNHQQQPTSSGQSVTIVPPILCGRWHWLPGSFGVFCVVLWYQKHEPLL